MPSYVATFFTHFDAMQYARKLEKLSVKGQLSPVPRSLSSSCGTCVRFAFKGDTKALLSDSLEQLVRLEGADFILVQDNRHG